MKIVLLGKNGQVGSALQRTLAPLGQLIALDRTNGGDLTRLDELTHTIQTTRPDIIVNAAAYTAVDQAETEIDLSNLVNAQAPQRLAELAKSTGALLVHYSTDYVFNGEGKQAWTETDQPQPINQYGKSKWMGEKHIQMAGCQHLIFRTSWVYGLQGKNFIKTILKLAQEREQLSIIADQIGVPTSADLIAEITAHCLLQALKQPTKQGVYHLVPDGETSWFEYTQFIIQTAKGLGESLTTQTVLPINSESYVAAAKRPLNSRLDTSKLTTHFSCDLPNWQQDVIQMVSALLGVLA